MNHSVLRIMYVLYLIHLLNLIFLSVCVCVCSHNLCCFSVKCSQGRAAWQERERGRRCSLSEEARQHRIKQSEAHHRWMKRNRVSHDNIIQSRSSGPIYRARCLLDMHEEWPAYNHQEVSLIGICIFCFRTLFVLLCFLCKSDFLSRIIFNRKQNAS